MTESAPNLSLALFGEVCRTHNIEVKALCGGRVLVLKRKGVTVHVYGWDFGVNSSTALLICRNKATCSAVLQDSHIPCLPHLVFYRPDRETFGFAHETSWSAMIDYFSSQRQGLVCKPNDLSRGVAVRRVSSVAELEKAVSEVFRYSRELCLSPFVSISAEYRVIVFCDCCHLMYVKRLPTVIGDGVSMLGELIAAAYGQSWTAGSLAEHLEEVEQVRQISYIPERGEVIPIGWRHNLAHGARAELLDPSSPELKVIVNMAISAAHSLDVVFAAIDVVEIAGTYKVLEVNTGVGTERLLRQVPAARSIVHDLYGAVVEHQFQSLERK